jgi:hypothetical protein
MLLKDRLGKREYVILTRIRKFSASNSDRNRGTVNSIRLMPFEASGFGGMNVEYAVLTPNERMYGNNSGMWNRYCKGRTGKDDTWIVEKLMN